MRTLLGCLLVVSISGWLGAEDKKDEKIDAQKLIGKWAHEESKDFRVEIEFTKDNKVMVTAFFKGESDKTEGTYKLDGAKIEVTLKDDGKEKKDTSTILKLTDTELTMTEGKDKKVTLTRVKSK